MFDKAAFEIIGRIGQVKASSSFVRVTIASNASYKKDGAWVEKVRWNEVIVFNERSVGWVVENLAKGQWVRATGSVQQNSYDKDGQTRYTVDLICEDISRLPMKRDPDTDVADRPEPAPTSQKGAATRVKKAKAPAMADSLDDDIPF